MNKSLITIFATYLVTAAIPCTAMIKKCTFSIISPQHHHIQPLEIHTLYKNFTVTEPVLIDLFNNPVMERIKLVRQYGSLNYVIKQKSSYTRYEHCVGVWALLRMYNATLEEQIAGLLHDASHTVFSHVGDILFDHHSMDSSYQDDIHEWYLKQWNIDTLLKQHNIMLNAILHKSGTHTMLEQDLPNICADRLEYNLQAGILTNILTTDDIPIILKDLQYDNGQWFFTNEESAKKLAEVSLFNTEHVWNGSVNNFIYIWTAHALQRALDIKLLTFDDIHFSTDPIVWDKLWISNDPTIINCLDKIVNYKKLVIITESDNNESLLAGKFRGLDPFIQDANQLRRLTSINSDYCNEYNRVKARCVNNA